eukprot:1157302-Pelagomonas_calceolata.AAC.35
MFILSHAFSHADANALLRECKNFFSPNASDGRLLAKQWAATLYVIWSQKRDSAKKVGSVLHDWSKHLIHGPRYNTDGQVRLLTGSAAHKGNSSRQRKSFRD